MSGDGVALAALLAVLGVAFVFWRRGRSVRRIEQDLPAALFSMASYDASAPAEAVLSGAAASSPEPLRSAFADAVRQVHAGVPFVTALSRLPGARSSALLDRVVHLLQAAYVSGADLSEAYRKVAEDAYAFQRLQAARREAFALQKYTLYAGAVLVPGLLGMLFSWSHGASSPYGDAVFWGLQVYLAAFGALSAAFIAIVDGDFRRLALRAGLLSFVALSAFHGVRLFAA